MKISAIRVENYKGYREEEFAFDDRFTLIIGDNGTGKTTILEALSIGIGGFLAGFEGVETRNIYKDEVRRSRVKLGDATVTWDRQFPVVISCLGEVGDDRYTWRRELKSTKGRTTRGDARDIINHAIRMQELVVKERDQEVILPMFSYQSAGRLFSQKRNMWTDPFVTEDLSRFLGYTHCLDAESDIKMFVSWLRRMTMIQLQKRKQIGELEAVMSAITSFMQGMLHNQEVTIYFDFEEEEVVVEQEGEAIPLRMMSAGYRSVIGMVADLAYRCAILNPQLRDRAVKETPGIVLIDELDLHLHPKWQWLIIENLKRVFPLIQFIATTHAPILIASCKDGMIINLETGISEKTPIFEPSARYGWLVEDILRRTMGAPNREPHVKKMIERLDLYYEKGLDGTLTGPEAREMEELADVIVRLLPEGDPAVALAELSALERKMVRDDDETGHENEETE